MTVPRVLGIRSPWSGDERDPIPWTYWPWFRAYRWVQIARHWVGWHRMEPRGGVRATYCHWCGRTR